MGISNTKYIWKPNEQFPGKTGEFKFKRPPEGIIIHAMVERLAGKPAPQWLAEDRGLSAHAFIYSDGVVEGGQPMTRKAYHAGVSAYSGLGSGLNANTLGIEILVPNQLLGKVSPEKEYLEFLKVIKTPWVTEQALDSAVETCRYWMKQYPSIEKKYILRHSDVSGQSLRGKHAKQDPGTGFPWEEFKRRINQL